MSFPHDCSLRDLKKYHPFEEMGKYINYAPGVIGFLMGGTKICNLDKNGWNVNSIVKGLERLEEAASADNCFFRVYTDAECADDKRKKDVVGMFLPKTADCGEKPFIVICAGGAYTGVCTAVEGFPVAAEFNKLGYDAFVITYRVGGKGLLPLPLDDLASAVRYIFANRESFGVSDEYVVSGFSAGGNLCALWGTDNKGWPHYGLKKPKAMMPVYSIVSSRHFSDNSVLKFCLKAMYGNNPSDALVEEYDVDKHMSENYPPCYIVCGSNDSCVPPANSEYLKECLDGLGIPAVLEEGANAEHGFGDGTDTDVEGWPVRADEFISSL